MSVHRGIFRSTKSSARIKDTKVDADKIATSMHRAAPRRHRERARRPMLGSKRYKGESWPKQREREVVIHAEESIVFSAFTEGNQVGYDEIC